MTTQVVTDEQLGRLAKRQADLFTRVRNGGANFEQAMRALQAAAEGQYFGYFPCQAYAQKYIPSGGKIQRDVEPSTFAVSELEFVQAYEPGVDCPVPGEQIHAKAINLGANLGLSDLKVVYEQQYDIRGEGIRSDGTVIAFLGTLINNQIACLRYSSADSKWYIARFYLNELERGSYRLPRVKHKVFRRQVERSYEARK